MKKVLSGLMAVIIATLGFSSFHLEKQAINDSNITLYSDEEDTGSMH